MKALSSKAQSHQLDVLAPSYAVSNSQLMETASFKASEWLLKHFPPPKSFHIFCGPGHNGGDGFATAFYLKKAGREVQLFSCESSNTLFNEKKKKAQTLNIEIKKLEEWKNQEGLVLIDSLFGVGLSRPLEGIFKDIVHKMNQSGQPLVALDTPSGLCADTGQIFGSGIKACYTLSFALGKPGFYLNEGPYHSGNIFIFPLEYPKELLDKVCNSIYLIDKKQVAAFLPSYKETANKSHKGWSLIAAGREGIWGCGLLACQAAYTVGSGYVTWASLNYPYEKSIQLPELLLNRLEDVNLFDKKTAIGAGPGLGLSKEIRNFIFKLKSLNLPVVLDADAITLLSRQTHSALNKKFLLSPHSGELSRLLNIPSKIIDDDRLLYAREGAKKCHSWLLLKGLHPVLSDGEKQWIIPYGHPALGKAGTGDVLTGLITGLMAQGLSVFKAGTLGTVLHGETARRWVQQGKDQNAFSASQIIEELPFVMSELHSLTHI